MQKYHFVEGVDEAWMEYSDRAERAYEAEQGDKFGCGGPDLYLASEVDARIAEYKKALRDALIQGESLNKHFYRDGPWEWVENIRKTLSL